MEAKSIRIVFMGTPEFAVPSLRALVEGGYNVVAVVTTPDKPAGRGRQLHESAVKIAARELGLPILQPEKLRDPAFVSAMEALRPDLGIVIAFRMLPEVIWAMPRLGTFNLHASLLPQYRGAAPINWALIDGRQETGVTTFLLNREIDKGAILGQRREAIAPDDTVGTLYERLMELGKGLVLETVEQLAEGRVVRTAAGGCDAPAGAQNLQGGLFDRLDAARAADRRFHPGPFARSGRMEPAFPRRRGAFVGQDLPRRLRTRRPRSRARNGRDRLADAARRGLRRRLDPARGAADRRQTPYGRPRAAGRIPRDRGLPVRLMR